MQDIYIAASIRNILTKNNITICNFIENDIINLPGHLRALNELSTYSLETLTCWHVWSTNLLEKGQRLANQV
jgi:hypothetical protein